MVGVPGRSKGCHTCRRRKIKCDLAKPNCERCQRSGRECEGYARGAVFLNRTPQGMLKREHLDEAEPRVKQTTESASLRESSPFAPAPTTHDSSDSSRQSSPAGSTYDVYATVPDRKVLTDALESYYVNRFVPLESRHGFDTCGIWSMKALGIINRGEALDNAFAALAFNRAGRDQNDPSLVQQGREAYGRALAACSKSILDPRAARSDQLLAACNLLKTYEIQEATGGSTSGHDSHIYGLTRLIQQRGKGGLRNEVNRFLVNEVRFSAMIIALQYRKRSPLGNEEWRPSSWKTAMDVQQTLYDNGFDLAALAEDIDLSVKAVGPEITAEEIKAFSSRILSVDHNLRQWHQRLLQEADLQLDWSNADALPGILPYQSPFDSLNDKPRIKISILWQRLMIMDHWSLRIALCIVLKTFEQDMMIKNPDSVGPQRSLVDVMLTLAENIANLAPLCLPSDNGIYGQSRTIYALRVGLIPSRMYKTPRALALKARYENLIQLVSTSAANVSAVSKVSDVWRTQVEQSDHEFVPQ